jgi:type II secretory pathway pseudopilin PulG
MVEVAISLAIIGIALVAIIGVLPLGMNVQRDNRETTVINQDATVFIEAIRNGSRGLDDLTNYVYGITNFQTEYNSSGNPVGLPVTYGYANSPSFLTNGLNIVGLLSMPEFVFRDFNGSLVPTNNIFSGGYSNHIIASVRSLSGPAVEKPPQNNEIIQADTFGYRIYCVNAAVAADTNVFNLPANQQVYSRQLAANLHELRLTFLWPVRPNGKLGNGRQTYRALIAGQTQHIVTNNLDLYFYQPQSFTNAP